jgi:3-phosphoshikimate 1-carboxyvinyltransferase
MALPDLIEIVPLSATVRAEITVPGSKSITNRALILAALADGEVTLKGALWSEDTQIMVACLKQLGFLVSVAPDPDEACNRTIMVIGEGGLVPAGGTETLPLDLFVGNAGTAARFLAPLLCLGSGVYRLHGVARMHERPQAALFQALRELGHRVESEFHNDKLPARIFAGTAGELPQSQTEFIVRKSAPVVPRKCRVSIAESSQFASALLLSSQIGNWEIEIVGENAEESPYVAMTSKLMEVFPKNGGTFQIEPDASSGSYFLAAGKIAKSPEFMEFSPRFGVEVSTQVLNNLKVLHWPKSGWQMDEVFDEFINLGYLGLEMRRLGGQEAMSRMPERAQIEALKQAMREKISISRATDLGDSIMTAIVLAADFEVSCGWRPPHAGIAAGIQFTDLGRLRVQESERVVALRTELTKCGVKVVEEGETLTVYSILPSELHGAEIETYHDHRMAMCFAILGLKVPGIKIKNPACVKKTFPNFFQKLAAPPPHGLGAEIWEIKNGLRIRKLSGEDLFAD